MDWTDGELAGLRESLEKSHAAELYIEYMDSKRLLDQVHFENVRRLLAYKYRSIKLDAIAVTDNDAFEFMRRYRDELFPRNSGGLHRSQTGSAPNSLAACADSPALLKRLIIPRPST